MSLSPIKTPIILYSYSEMKHFPPAPSPGLPELLGLPSYFPSSFVFHWIQQDPLILQP